MCLDYIFLPSENFPPDVTPVSHRQPTGEYNPGPCPQPASSTAFSYVSLLYFQCLLTFNLSQKCLKKNHRESLSFLAFQSHEQWDEDAINKEGKKTRDAFALEQATIKTGIGGIMFAFILTMKYFVSETETKSYVLKNEMSFSFTPPSYFLKPQTSCHVKI